MDEYEVDLRDYVRVLWRWKWLVIGVIVVAVGLSGLLTLRAPEEHRGEAVLELASAPGLPASIEPPSLDLLAGRATDPQLTERAARDTGISSRWIAEHLRADHARGVLTVTLQGDRPPDEIEQSLVGMTRALQDEAREMVEVAAAWRLEALALERETLGQRRSGWEAELAAARAQEEARLQVLLDELAQRRDDAQFLAMQLGDQMTIRSYLAMKELDLLFGRIERVEQALQDIDRFGVLYLPGVGDEWRDIEGRLLDLDAEEAALRALIGGQTDLLTVVQGPAGAITTLRPSLRMNLAVAGVLGLFVGVLLAFVAHAIKPRDADSTLGQGKKDGTDALDRDVPHKPTDGPGGR